MLKHCSIFFILTMPLGSGAELFADDIKVESINGRITLKAESCKSLKEEINAISEFNRHFYFNKLAMFYTQSPPHYPSIELDCSLEEKKEMDITHLIPMEILSFHEKHSSCLGPNCLNTAFFMTGLVKFLRYTNEDEMKYFLKNHCMFIPSPDSALPGDIGMIGPIDHAETLDFIHGFLNIGKDVVFTKNGQHPDAPYLVQSKQKMLMEYRLRYEDHGEDRSDQRLTMGNRLTYGIFYYRCDPFSVVESNMELIEAENMLAQCIQEKRFEQLKMLSPIILAIQKIYSKDEKLQAQTNSMLSQIRKLTE